MDSDIKWKSNIIIQNQALMDGALIDMFVMTWTHILYLIKNK